MSKSLVQISDPAPSIRVIEFNRPEKRNALCLELLTPFADAVEACDPAAGQRVVIIKGAGACFCAGLDLQEAQDASKAERSAQEVARSLLALSQTPAVTIAAVHGAAIAGGAGLMSACDFVVAADKTQIGYPEIHRGLVAGLVMTFLRRQLRERDVRELLLLGEIIDATRAQRIGLVNRVLPPNEVMDGALILARQILKGAPKAVSHTKAMIDELWWREVREDLQWAHEHHLEARHSDEAVEGRQAFLEKRPPRWLSG